MISFKTKAFSTAVKYLYLQTLSSLTTQVSYMDVPGRAQQCQGNARQGCSNAKKTCVYLSKYRKHGNSHFQLIFSALHSFWTKELSKEEESKKRQVKIQETTTKFHLHSWNYVAP